LDGQSNHLKKDDGFPMAGNQIFIPIVASSAFQKKKKHAFIFWAGDRPRKY